MSWLDRCSTLQLARNVGLAACAECIVTRVASAGHSTRPGCVRRQVDERQHAAHNGQPFRRLIGGCAGFERPGSPGFATCGRILGVDFGLDLRAGERLVAGFLGSTALVAHADEHNAAQGRS